MSSPIYAMPREYTLAWLGIFPGLFVSLSSYQWEERRITSRQLVDMNMHAVISALEIIVATAVIYTKAKQLSRTELKQAQA